MSHLFPTSTSEPITPYLHRVSSLSTHANISSILVIGSSGDYFDVASTVLRMDSYACSDVTVQAKDVVNMLNQGIIACLPWKYKTISNRYVDSNVLLKRDSNVRVTARTVDKISYGDEVEIDLKGLEQLCCVGQTNAIAYVLANYLTSNSNSNNNNNTTPVRIDELMYNLENDISNHGLTKALGCNFDGMVARPRRFEIVMAINRLRVKGLILQIAD